ncbi:MORN1 [Symbiodinium sp. CCMP2592]|nr:MORN1 [Symbiodinium sp. CCMP2592]
MCTASSTIHLAQREKNHAGARYEGEVSISSGQREGRGTYFYTNPYFVYEGEWLDGKKHGQGRLTFGEDGFYEGCFEAGEISGSGRHELHGNVYVGDFLAGQKHGQGVLNKTDGTQYTGSWAHGLYSGEGTLSLPSGERYVGGFRAHKFHGRGIHDQPSKAMHYEGHFEVGLRHGYGELQERDGASTYVGDFKAGRRHGVGKAGDQVSGISYEGPWVEDQPESPAAAWDVCPIDAEESYLAVAELLKEEAANQLAASNPKDKKKGKPPAPVDTTGAGPELKGFKGQALPETVVRLVDASKAVVPAEVGRRFRITMYKERRGSEDPEEVLRRPVNFGDMRQTYVDPLDEADAPKAAPKKGGKSSPVPDEDAEPPNPGVEALEGRIEEGGRSIIGGTDEWLLPVHLQPALYWLRLEDVTELDGSIWPRLEPLELPFRVE